MAGQQQPQAAPAQPPAAGGNIETLPKTPPLIHKAAIAGAVISPLVMLIPPRRMDWRFLMLTSTFSISTSQLAYDWTGRSIYDRVGARFEKLFSSDLPDGARETQRRLREEKMRREGLSEEEMYRIEASKRNALQRMWYGDETSASWQQSRAKEHQRALDEGKGLSGIIMDQIKEVMPESGAEKSNTGGDEKETKKSAEEGKKP